MSVRRPRLCRCCRVDGAALAAGALAVALAAVSPAATGASWVVETGIVGQVTASNNADFDTGNTRESDTIVVVAPTIAVHGVGRRLRLSGSAELATVNYLDDSQRDRFDPVGSLSATLEAIDRWLFVDASLAARRSVIDPLAPRPEEPSGFNRLTEVTARVSPYIDRTFPNDLRLRLRSDLAWTDVRGGAVQAPSEHAARHSLSLSRVPRPLGWALEAERRFDDRIEIATGARDWYEIARLRIGYEFGGRLLLGARAGYERSQLFLTDASKSFVGAELRWLPSPRSRLEGYWEARSFGDAWNVAFNHRSPFVAWDFRATRDLTTFDDAALTLPATADLAGLLDAALQTRIADPIERARAVEEFIAIRRLPRSLPGAINVFSERILVRNSRTGTLTLIGVRSTLVLSGFHQRDTTPAGDLFSIALQQRVDLDQRGASLALSRRLSSLSSVAASASWTRTGDAIGPIAASPPAPAAQSRQVAYRMQLDRQLAPRSTGFVGVRWRSFDSNVLVDARETAVFAGVGHRF